MPKFSKRSISILHKAHPDLIELFEEVIKGYGCTIICSVRDAEAQQKAFDNGLSRAKPGQSPHNFEPSLAIDAVPDVILGGKKGEIVLDWNSKDKEVQRLVHEEMLHFGGYVKGVAASLGIKVQWGRDFKSFKDMPHWELQDWETHKPKGL